MNAVCQLHREIFINKLVFMYEIKVTIIHEDKISQYIYKIIIIKRKKLTTENNPK